MANEELSGLEELFGYTLISVSFGTGFYSLLFQGEKDNKMSIYEVGTGDCICESINILEDVLEKVSVLLWPFLTKTLIGAKVHESENFRAMELLFDNNQSFLIWQDASANDNLLEVRNPDSKEWYVLL